MQDLTKQNCVPCEGGIPPYTIEQINQYKSSIQSEWEVVEQKKLRRQFKFKGFKQAMAFVNQVAELAEAQGHHPDIYIFYNKVTIELWTHAIKGLFSNDFIMAAKIERIKAIL